MIILKGNLIDNKINVIIKSKDSTHYTLEEKQILMDTDDKILIIKKLLKEIK